MRSVYGMSAGEISKVFAGWKSGDLDSYLIEITATVLAKQDPSSKSALVDMIRDEAEQERVPAAGPRNRPWNWACSPITAIHRRRCSPAPYPVSLGPA